MKGVCSRLGDYIHNRSRIAANVGAVQVGLYLEFAYGLHRGPKDDRQRQALVVIYAVIKEVVGSFPIAVGKNFRCRPTIVRSASAHNGAARGKSHTIYTRAQRCQLDEVSAIQRK